MADVSPLPLGYISQLSMPETWASIPAVESDPDWTRDVAELLCDGASAQSALAAKLAENHAALIEEPHLILGVWVPDRALPDVAGLMFVDWVVPAEGLPVNRETYRALIDPDRRTDHVTFSRHVAELDVPAGEALVVREVIARPRRAWRKTVQENIVYTVFPPGCSDALKLTFVSFAPELGDALADDAAVGVDSLRVVLDGAER